LFRAQLPQKPDFARGPPPGEGDITRKDPKRTGFFLGIWSAAFKKKPGKNLRIEIRFGRSGSLRKTGAPRRVIRFGGPRIQGAGAGAAEGLPPIPGCPKKGGLPGGDFSLGFERGSPSDCKEMGGVLRTGAMGGPNPSSKPKKGFPLCTQGISTN